ncbi:hypothetical protein OMP38_28880 [Cohnella ginsengisoli]|uniref:Uncharacterized protein n=1 Tax=Cohnella ginsengisoli TaxID=425004 RepID=A0A9X4KME8_9BACL|nr:hypothetical protein [Cohnella ginsengisoli]MDG0794401.1 hypothetical protein [Cohnella ginsengisoli]
MYLIAAPIVFMLSPMYVLGGYLGWLAIPCASLFSMLFAFFSIRVAYAFKGREWAEYGGVIVGRWLHFFFFRACAAVLPYGRDALRFRLFGPVHLGLSGGDAHAGDAGMFSDLRRACRALRHSLDRAAQRRFFPLRIRDDGARPVRTAVQNGLRHDGRAFLRIGRQPNWFLPRFSPSAG